MAMATMVLLMCRFEACAWLEVSRVWVFDRAYQATDASERPCIDLALVIKSRALASPIKLVPGYLRQEG